MYTIPSASIQNIKVTDHTYSYQKNLSSNLPNEIHKVFMYNPVFLYLEFSGKYESIYIYQRRIYLRMQVIRHEMKKMSYIDVPRYHLIHVKIRSHDAAQREKARKSERLIGGWRVKTRGYASHVLAFKGKVFTRQFDSSTSRRA